MTLLQSNPMSFGVTPERMRLVLVDLDALPPAREYTAEEIERDPELKFLLNFPVATDEEILAIEEAIKGSNLHGN